MELFNYKIYGDNKIRYNCIQAVSEAPRDVPGLRRVPYPWSKGKGSQNEPICPNQMAL